MPDNRPVFGIFEDMAQAEQHIYGRHIIHGGKVWNITRITAPDRDDHMLDFHGVARVRCESRMRPTQTFDIDDALFNSYRFDPLGWINHETGVVLTETIPVRQTRRGYGDENLGLWTFPRQGQNLDRPEDIGSYDVLYSEGFEEMLGSTYPAYLDVAREVVACDHRMALAISRDYMLQSDSDGFTWLWRYADRIGMLAAADTIQLGRRFQYLKEEITDSPVFGREVWVK